MGLYWLSIGKGIGPSVRLGRFQSQDHRYFVAVVLFGAVDAIGPNLHREGFHGDFVKSLFFKEIRFEGQGK